MKNAFLVIIALILLSCNKPLSIGQYYSKKTSKSLILNKDSTFKYQNGNSHFIEFSSGTWRHEKKDVIVLNSDFKDSLLIKNIDEYPSANIKQITVSAEITNRNRNSIYLCQIVINDIWGDKKIYNNDPLIFDVSDEIKSVRIMISKMNSTNNVVYKYLITPAYSPKNINNSIRIDLKFNDTLFQYHVFTNQVVKYANNHVELLDQEKGLWLKIPKITD